MHNKLIKFIESCELPTEIANFRLYAFKENLYNLENKKCIIKGLRKGRNILDIIFTFGMALLSSILFKIKLFPLEAAAYLKWSYSEAPTRTPSLPDQYY